MEKKDFCKVKQWKENINEKQFHISQVKRKNEEKDEKRYSEEMGS